MKGGRRVTFAINDVLHEALDAYLAVRQVVPHRALFVSDRGSRISTRTVQANIHALAVKAGIVGNKRGRRTTARRVSPHVLRHSFATRLAKLGVQMPTISQALGHRSLLTTERYVHLGLEERRAAVQTFGEHWKRLRGATAQESDSSCGCS